MATHYFFDTMQVMSQTSAPTGLQSYEKICKHKQCANIYTYVYLYYICMYINQHINLSISTISGGSSALPGIH